MSKLRISLTILLLPLFSGCTAIDAFLFEAYPDGTPISQERPQQAEQVTPAAEESGGDVELRDEAAALRDELKQQQAELEALKQKKAADEAAAAAAIKEQLWVRIAFRSGQTALTSQTKRTIKELSNKFLAQPRTQTIEVRGYCDDEPIGGYSGKQRSAHSFDSQVALSQARADAIAAEFKKAGIPAEAVHAMGFGATDFIADNATVEGRNKNRRVDIFLVEK